MTLTMQHLLHDVSEFHRLSGFSGAEVYRATRDGRHWFVRKLAATPDLSPRLRVQAEKQTAFAREAGDCLRTPAILEQGEVEGRFYVDMEFVRGLDAVSFLRQAPYREVTKFGDRLCEFLRTAAARPALCPSGAIGLFEALYAKLCEVQRRTQRLSAEHLSRLLLALDRLRTMPPLSPTLCHGDLTLQNLIVDESGEIWCFDMLDTPYEHYWQDAAKLHQDLSGGWFRLNHGKIAQCVLDYLSQQVQATAAALDPAYAAAHPLLLACTFARILPYAQTAEQVQFVTERIAFFTAQTVI